MRAKKLILVVATTILPTTMWAGVIVNELFYDAPNDLENLQWIEFYNDEDTPVDLTDCTLDAGKIFTFPKPTTIGGREYVVVALEPDRFAES